MKKLLTILVLIGISSAAFASMAPYYDRNEQIKTVLDSDALANKIDGGDGISSITRVASLKYKVKTSDGCTAYVYLKVLPPPQDDGWAGPTQYAVKKVTTGVCAN